jgi:23S rRNA pseudouridine1911/1915/1917 synthase
LQSWIEKERVLLGGSIALSKQKIWGGEKIRLAIEPDRSETPYIAEKIALNIVYEDEALLVINKPVGMVVHPGSGNWQGTLLNGLLEYLPQLAEIPRAGIVHRLDKDTTGLLVVAKTLTAQTDLVRQLQARSVNREYLAVVHGVVDHDGKIEAAIGRNPTQRTKMATVASGKAAVTRFKVLERFPGFSLVECKLETGRTHQIRVHMQSINHPLVGDSVYAGRKSAKNLQFNRQALHAYRLGLIHPVTKEAMSWQIELPDDMQQLLSALRALNDS